MIKLLKGGLLGIVFLISLLFSNNTFAQMVTNCVEVYSADQTDPNSTPNNGNSSENDYSCAKFCSGISIINIVEVYSVDQTDPNSTPNNNNPSENDWAKVQICLPSLTCVSPTSITFTQVAPTCAGATANNNGTISLATATNGTHFGISTLNAASYDGPTTIATATALGALPMVIKSSVPNTGGTYRVRIFNGADGCFTDQTVTVNAVTCTCPTPNCGTGTVIKN